MALLACATLFGCDSQAAAPAAKQGEYTGGCAGGDCDDASTCFQFRAATGEIIGALCSTTCMADPDCADGGACVTFAASARYCLLPCDAGGCPSGTSCRTKFDGTRDLCFSP